MNKHNWKCSVQFTERLDPFQI